MGVVSKNIYFGNNYYMRKKCIICLKNKFSLLKTFLNINYYRCENCNFHFQKTPKKINYKTKKYHDYTDKFGQKRFRLQNNEVKERVDNWYGDIISFINNLKRKNIKILDYGSGPGHLLNFINSKYKYCFELNEIHKINIKKNYKSVKILNNPFDKKYLNYFDVIVFYHVIEHIEKPTHILIKLKKILKKNGTLIVGTPNIDSIGYKLFRGNFRLFDKEHLYMFGEKSLSIILEKFNFKIFKKEYPFFKTTYFNLKNLFLMLLVWKLSPPFYKNVMTYYCTKKD